MNDFVKENEERERERDGSLVYIYLGVTLSIFHDLGSKVKVTTEVIFRNFCKKCGKFDEMSRKLKIIFSNISYKFHENLEIFTRVSSIQVYVLDLSLRYLEGEN